MSGATRTHAISAVDRAAVGVFAWRTRTGAPRSCAVTPYVVDGHAVVTSTLALPTKAAAVRRDPRVALLAGGWLVRGEALVGVDRSPDWFDRNLRAQELRKYPAGRALLGLPFHRRVVPWYVGRVVVALVEAEATPVDGSDRTTVTVVRDGIPWITPVAEPAADAPEVPVPTSLEGPADLLVHEEHDDMAELRQLHLRGEIAGGRLVVRDRQGSLEPGPTGTVAQLRKLRALGRAARAGAPRLAGWPPPPVG